MGHLPFEWVAQYGYTAIFSLLVLGIVGLPVPDETLLTFCGYLIYRRELQLVPTFVAALSGSACGITLSYVLGRTFGLHLIHRYGRYVGLTDKRLAKVHDWFERAGRWSLTFGYFIPGIRHFTAYVAGSSYLETHVFAVFAYSGALLWTTTFLSLGYVLGDGWERVSKEIHSKLLIATVIVVALLLAWFAFRKFRRKA